MAIEKTKYTELKKDGKFEIRKYDPHVLAETFVEGDLEDAGSEGFRRLFDYISGENTKKQSISMTAPVEQEGNSEKIAMTSPVSQEKTGNRWRVAFLMPAKYTLETLPKPNDERIKIVQAPARLVIAVRYSGKWSKEGYEKNKALLQEYMLKHGYTAAGIPIWARYDPPFMPWFMRRNEVLIPLKQF
jgi:effector-binding domain-containing protein